MNHAMARLLMLLASPVLLAIYWRNNIKKVDFDELHQLISYNDLGSFFPER